MVCRFGVELGRRNRGLAIALSLAIGLCACQLNPSDRSIPSPPVRQSATSAKPVVLTTFTVLADMARNVAGDRAIVTSITKPGAEIHGYQPTPSDLERGQSAQLILDNGLNLERWADRFYSNLPQVPHVTLSQGVPPISISGEGDKPNPHAWMSPANAVIYVENIRQALSQIDPGGAPIYQANAVAYRQQIEAIDRRLKQAIATLPPQRRTLVSCEGAFSYVTRDYGLGEVYLWAVNAEQQATPKQMQRAIETVKAQNIPAVFCESTVNPSAQQQVAQESGATLAGVLYVDSLSPPDGPAATYLKLLDHNITTIIAGLRGAPPATPVPTN